MEPPKRFMIGLVLFTLLTSCGGVGGTGTLPSSDVADAPELDAPLDAVVAPLDRQAVADLSRIDGPRDGAVDRSPSFDLPRVACPSNCVTSAQCAQCTSTPGETYCCVSGLCLFWSESTCAAIPEPNPNPIIEDPDLSTDAGRDGAAEAASEPMDVSSPDDAPRDVASDIVHDATVDATP